MVYIGDCGEDRPRRTAWRDNRSPALGTFKLTPLDRRNVISGVIGDDADGVNPAGERVNGVHNCLDPSRLLDLDRVNPAVESVHRGHEGGQRAVDIVDRGMGSCGRGCRRYGCGAECGAGDWVGRADRHVVDEDRLRATWRYGGSTNVAAAAAAAAAVGVAVGVAAAVAVLRAVAKKTLKMRRINDGKGRIAAAVNVSVRCKASG